MFGGNFAPSGWKLCEGQQLQIAEYDALYNLLGTTYGGDGQQTFALPDLRGRIPLHMGSQSGSTYAQGQAAGVEAVTLNTQQLPPHSHGVPASTATGYLASPTGAVFAKHRDHKAFANGAPTTPMAGAMVASQGNNQPHANLPPYLCVNFIISMFGTFPNQS